MATDHEEKMLNLTRQMRHNQSDLQSFLSDMDSWETDIKKKEENMLSGQSEKNGSLPPVRNTIDKKKLRKKKKEKVIDPDKQKKKISGFDFKSWDKFDVDAALDEIDKEEKRETSSSEYETDEEWEMERRVHLAGQEKEKGNAFLKDGEYDQAVEAYSRGIEYDPTNAVLPANRAMALLKQQKYAAAELDCTLSISLDPLYIKAYLRRATSRANLNKKKEAIEDYNRVLDLEPTNKMATTELEQLQKEKERDEKGVIPSSLTDDDRGRVKAIYKSPEERSKVPLKRVTIEEIGIETRDRHQQPLTEQSDLTKKITERESKNFENLLSSSQKPVSACKNVNVHQTDKSNLEDNSVNNSIELEKDSGVSKRKDEVKEVSREVKVNGHHTASPKPESSSVSPIKPAPSQRRSTDVPSPPHTSFQFQTDFKLLRNNTESFFEYFSAISPSEYPKLFGQCLDADILMTIINSLLKHSHGTATNAYEVLSGLTQVRRFSMTAMFLSKKEKQAADQLIESMSSSSLCTPDQLKSLKQKYDL